LDVEFTLGVTGKGIAFVIDNITAKRTQPAGQLETDLTHAQNTYC